MRQTPFDFTSQNNIDFNQPDGNVDQNQQHVAGFTYQPMVGSVSEVDFAGYYRPWPFSEECWTYEAAFPNQSGMPPDSMTPDTNTTSSGAYSDVDMTRSRSVSTSTDYSEQAAREFAMLPMTINFSQSQAELLSNVGSNFADGFANHIQHSNFFPVYDASVGSAGSHGFSTAEAGMLSFANVTDPRSNEAELCQTFTPNSSQSSTTGSQNGNGATSVHGRRPNARKSKPAEEEETRLYCQLCIGSKDQEKGFKGEHEFIRHYKRTHLSWKLLWVCIDLTPDHKLSSCDRCSKGHTYGQEYGGAEHMRRRHTWIFGPEMMETLKGRTHRRGLSLKKLKAAGWLKQIWVHDGVAAENEPAVVGSTTGAGHAYRALAPRTDTQFEGEHSQAPGPFEQHGQQSWGDGFG